MDIELIEKNNQDNTKNELLKKKYTVNSIDSSPEFQHKTYLSKIIIIMSLLSLIIGIYIFLNKSYYLNPVYNFSNQKILWYYLIIYTLGLFGVILTAFVLALLIKLISSMRKCLKSKKSEKEKEKKLIDEEIDEVDDDDDEDNIFTQMLENADNISMIPYTFTICVLLTIILYVVGFPFSWFLIYSLSRNIFYKYFYNFFLLYFFLFINSVSGAILLFVSVIFIIAKRQISVRKLSFTYDEDNLNAIYKEVKDAIDLGK